MEKEGQPEPPLQPIDVNHLVINASKIALTFKPRSPKATSAYYITERGSSQPAYAPGPQAQPQGGPPAVPQGTQQDLSCTVPSTQRPVAPPTAGQQRQGGLSRIPRWTGHVERRAAAGLASQGPPTLPFVSSHPSAIHGAPTAHRAALTANTGGAIHALHTAPAPSSAVQPASAASGTLHRAAHPEQPPLRPAQPTAPPLAAAAVRPTLPSAHPPGTEAMRIWDSVMAPPTLPFASPGPGAPDPLSAPDPEEAARQARRRHRRAVARIVVDHWKRFARGRLRALAAHRHYCRRLLLAALLAWRAQVAAGRVRQRQAAVFALRRAYLGLGAWLRAWHSVALRAAQLRALLQAAAAARAGRVARECLRAWRQRCYYSADKRRMQLQALYYWSFTVLTRALRRWRMWVLSRRCKAQRQADADAHHTVALRRRVLARLRGRRVLMAWKATAEGAAAAFRRHWALRCALRRWRVAAAWCGAMRAAGAAAMGAARERLRVDTALVALREWRAYAAAKRARRQRGRYAEAYMRRWRQLVVCWGWRRQAARERHLRACAAEMQKVGRRVRLAVAWGRWWGAVEVAAGQRCAELRAAVLLRAAWAVLRRYAERRAAKRELQALACQRVGRVALAACLATWRGRAAAWRRKAQARERAAAWHRGRALRAALGAWRREAARLAAKALAAEAAGQHWRRGVLRRAMTAWKRYTWRRRMKAVAALHRPRRLAATALATWLALARRKAAAELARRKAVRHRYLSLLRRGLHALLRAMARRRDKAQLWADLATLHALRLAAAALAAWRRQYLPAAAAKRRVLAGARAHWRARLTRHVLAGWAQQAERLAAKRVVLLQAGGFASLRLLRRSLQRWAAAVTAAVAARAAAELRLEAAVAALLAATARRVLAAWGEAANRLAVKRWMLTRAQASRRHSVLRRSLAAWALALAACRVRRLREAQARALWCRRALLRALGALAAHVAARRTKRRRLAAALNHERRRLLAAGLVALAWYGRYRAAKRRGYAAARAQYVARLRRQGAVRWLEAGGVARQQRLQLLAAEQARRLAQQLARAEPFARRWLHATRCRRAERLRAVAAAAAAAAAGSRNPGVWGTVTVTTAARSPPRGSWVTEGQGAPLLPLPPGVRHAGLQQPHRQPQQEQQVYHQYQPAGVAFAAAGFTVPDAGGRTGSPLFRRPRDPPRTPVQTGHFMHPVTGMGPDPPQGWGHSPQRPAAPSSLPGALAAASLPGNLPGQGQVQGQARGRVGGAPAVALGSLSPVAGGVAGARRPRPQPRCPSYLAQQLQPQPQRPAMAPGPEGSGAGHVEKVDGEVRGAADPTHPAALSLYLRG